VLSAQAAPPKPVSRLASQLSPSQSSSKVSQSEPWQASIWVGVVAQFSKDKVKVPSAQAQVSPQEPAGAFAQTMVPPFEPQSMVNDLLISFKLAWVVPGTYTVAPTKFLFKLVVTLPEAVKGIEGLPFPQAANKPNARTRTKALPVNESVFTNFPFHLSVPH